MLQAVHDAYTDRMSIIMVGLTVHPSGPEVEITRGEANGVGRRLFHARLSKYE